LEKINNSVTIASGTGVTSLSGTTNQVTVSGATGAITISFPTNLVLAGNVSVPADGKIIDTANANYFTPKDQYGNMYHKLTSGSFYVDSNNYYFRNQAATDLLVIGSTGNAVLRGNLSGAAAAGVPLTLGTWSASATWGAIQGGNGYLLLTHNGSDRSIYLRTSDTGNVNIGGNGTNTLVVGNGATSITGYLAVGATGVTDNNSISCSGWFRSTGTTGWYSQTYAGGIYMIDSTWLRVYNDKNFYTLGEIRSGNSFSCNATRLRGSYGSINIGSNGKTNDWQGFEFQVPETQTFMVQNDNYSGMYRANSTWNWLWSYSTLVIPSDIRYKREIEPLNIGLNFIKELEPISYLKVTERPDDDPDATEKGYYYGFSAQNVRAALDACGETRDVKIHDIGGPNMGLVACTEDAVYDRQFLGISEFMGPVVLAIKELEQRVSQLEGTV